MACPMPDPAGPLVEADSGPGSGVRAALRRQQRRFAAEERIRVALRADQRSARSARAGLARPPGSAQPGTVRPPRRPGRPEVPSLDDLPLPVHQPDALFGDDEPSGEDDR